MENAFYLGADANADCKLEPLEEQDVKPCISRKRQHSFGSDTFSEYEEREIRRKLDTGLSRNETMQRPGPGGCRLTYIEGWKVIHDANQIFGFNGWSSQIMQLELRYVDEKQGRFSACVSACVRITLRDGAFREDRGGGSADNMRSKGDAILKAEKEAVTDATKRALKNFGLRLGLSLYDRQHVRDMNRGQVRESNQQMATGIQTPTGNRQGAGRGGGHGTGKNVGSSPVTPGTMQRVGSGGGGGGGGAQNGQIAVKREQAIQRQQAFLRARAAQEKGVKTEGSGTNAIRAQHGVSMMNAVANNATCVAVGNGIGSGRPTLSHHNSTRPTSAYAECGNGRRGNAVNGGNHDKGKANSTGGVHAVGLQAENVITRDGSCIETRTYKTRGAGGAAGTAGTAGAAFGNTVHDAPPAAGNLSSRPRADAAIRQREIDELSRMALADM